MEYFIIMTKKYRKTRNNYLILIDGGPASGKNTLGKILVEKFNKQGNKSILLDLDSYVEKICPAWIWNDEGQKGKDLLNAGMNFIKNINKYLEAGLIVIAIGERFLRKKDVAKYTSNLSVKQSVYLYHLKIPLDLRRERLKQRGQHSLIDLDKDQKERDAIKKWPGYVYQNTNLPDVDASNLMKLVKNGLGLIM